MRTRLLTTAAAMALVAALAAPTMALAASATPTSSTGATTGTSTSTGGSLSEPAGVDSNATTPSVYAPSAPAGSAGAGAGSAGTGSGLVAPSGNASSGPLGNSTSPTSSPSSASTVSSRSASSGMTGTVAGSTLTGTMVPGTETVIDGQSPLGIAYGGRTVYRAVYVGAAYETSVEGTAHARRSASGELGPLEAESRYEALAREIQENAGDTRGMADRNGTGLLPMEDVSIKTDSGSSY